MYAVSYSYECFYYFFILFNVINCCFKLFNVILNYLKHVFYCSMFNY